MHTAQATFCLFALYVVAVLGGPTPSKTSFVHRVQARDAHHQVHKPMAGMKAMVKAYKKFGFDMSAMPAMPAVKAAAAPGTTTGQTGAVQASPEPNDSEYLEKVNIAGQAVMLDFDTGSSDLWVFTPALPQAASQGHTLFDSTKSKTFKPLQGATWNIMYGDGSGAGGVVGKDVVAIGSATATSQAVELATSVSASFTQDTANDGLLGLAFSNLNTVKPQQQTTFFDTIMPQLKMPVFSVDLRQNATGSYTFGAIDNTKFTGQLNTVPVQFQTGFWQFNSPSFTVANQQFANQGGSPGIADTGTSLLLVDPQVAAAYYSKVQGATNNAQAGGFTYPCTAQLPNFGVAIGSNYTAVVPGSGITFAQVDAQTCFGGIQSNGGAPMQIYGDVMFRSQYVVFDGGAKALRIAPKSQM